MACYGFMFKGRCFPIYMIEVKWPPKEPEPDPRTQIFNDARILTTIDQGIAHISDRRLRDTLAQAVHSAARSLDLPDGMEWGDGLFKGAKAMEPA